VRLAALLALALGGCAVAPPPVPPLPYPPSAAQRVIRIAVAEWQDWGAPVRDAFAVTPGERREGAEAWPDNFPRVLAYWRAVPVDYDAIRDNRRFYAEVLAGQPVALWAEPAWSAAFISWVFRSAGVDAREFPPNATHAFYLDALIADARVFPGHAPFLPHAPEKYAPRGGDLICRDRSRAPLRHWTERLAETGIAREMHCDIVVGVGPDRVEAIGGNVADAVTLSRFPTAADGRLLPAPPGRAPVLVVMESRLGRLPPWSEPPTWPISSNR
jgi:hypothetical protein